MTKEEYITKCTSAMYTFTPEVANAALIFYHSEVPIEEALKYLSTLSKKLKPKRKPSLKSKHV